VIPLGPALFQTELLVIRQLFSFAAAPHHADMKRRLLAPAPAQKCTLGDPGLDALLRGGVPCGSITELVGELDVRIVAACLGLSTPS
jgi:hypothetical protein